jgi:hypothetical protein
MNSIAEQQYNEQIVVSGGRWRHLLLLQVILTRAPGLATRERALVLLLAGVDPCVSLQMATGGEGLLTSRTEM